MRVFARIREERMLGKFLPSLCLGFTIEMLGWNVSEWKELKKTFIHQVFIKCLLGASCVGISNKTQPLLSGPMLDSGKREHEPVSGGNKCFAQIIKGGGRKATSK